MWFGHYIHMSHQQVISLRKRTNYTLSFHRKAPRAHNYILSVFTNLKAPRAYNYVLSIFTNLKAPRAYNYVLLVFTNLKAPRAYNYVLSVFTNLKAPRTHNYALNFHYLENPKSLFFPSYIAALSLALFKNYD